MESEILSDAAEAFAQGEGAGFVKRNARTAELPVIGQKVSWIDESQGSTLDVWMRCRSLVYDFNNNEVVMEGEGGIT